MQTEKQTSFLKITSLIFFLTSVVLGAVLIFRQSSNKNTVSNTDSVATVKPVASTNVDMSYEFPVKKGSEDLFKISVVKAEVTERIATQNQPLEAKDDEEFLLLYLEIENRGDTPLEVDVQNYFRMLADGDKKIAPDFYNGIIQIVPISTKKDQLGFVVKKGQREFNFNVGEINGEKQVLNFSF